MGGKRITPEEFEREMARVHPEMTIVGPFVNKTTPVRVRCDVCGRKSSPQPNNLLGSKNKKPSGCKYCAGNVAMSNEEFVAKLAAANPTVGQFLRRHGARHLRAEARRRH